MYWVVMAIVALMIAYGKYRAEPLSHFLYSMTLLPQQGASAYDISWTLEREMVFYVLAAIVVPVSGIYGLAITLAALAFAGWWLGNPWSFHLLSTTQADFLAGVVVFAARPRPQTRSGRTDRSRRYAALVHPIARFPILGDLVYGRAANGDGQSPPALVARPIPLGGARRRRVLLDLSAPLFGVLPVRGVVGTVVVARVDV